MTSVETIKRQHMHWRNEIATKTEFEWPEGVHPQQLGFSTAFIDERGRIWSVVGSTMKMIFDPMWLHPSKRWCGPTEVPRR